MSFTIITTVLNNDQFIHHCLESVKNQKINKNKIEHLIIDAGSSDKTVDIIRKFRKKNKYVKFFLKKNFSIYQGINFGIKASKKKYIGLLHSDDFFYNNNVLNTLEKNFEKRKKIEAIYSNVIVVKKNNHKKTLRYFKSRNLKKKDYLKYEHPPHTGLFLKKSVFEKHGLYDENFKIASDFEFMLRVLGINNIKSKYINKTLVVMRSGGTSTKSLKNVIISNYEALKSFKKNNLKINFIYIFAKIFRKIIQIKFFN